jgi:tyrosine-protein phosphatase YwqE
MRLNIPYIFMLNKYEPVIITIRKNNNIYETIIKTDDLYDLNIGTQVQNSYIQPHVETRAQNNKLFDEEYAPNNN